MDYFESDEFRHLLKSYEDAKSDGANCYLDTDDFVDIAEYYIRNQDFDEALAATEDGLLIHPDDMGLRGMRVSALINLNRIDEAHKALGQVDPEENFDYYYLEAQLVLADNWDSSEANDLFLKWLDLEIDDMRSEFHGKIDQQRLHEDYMHVIASFSELNQEDDEVQVLIGKWVDDFRARCEHIGRYECDAEIAHVCHEEGLIDKEIELYNNFLDNDPYMDGGWTYLASIQHMNGQVDDAINSAGFALAINPDDSFTLMLRAHSYFVSERFTEALNDYLRYERLTGENDHAHIIGRCFIMIGKRKQGYEYLEKAVAVNSSHGGDADSAANIWAFIAQAFLDGGFLKEAQECVEKAAELVSDSTEYIMLKANVLLQMKELDEARYWFRKSLETTNKRVMVEMYIGGAFLYENMFDDALEYFRMATEEPDDPMSVRAHAYLSYLFFRMEDKENFRRSLRIACESTPETIRAFWDTELSGVPESDYYDRLKDLI
ncbi:MAG: tetratricopeptide repeat protein [Bacteroidaceae bacterium]|nr:tetratricopeptide repeat protein [Bacteroidaceae bacterium]